MIFYVCDVKQCGSNQALVIDLIRLNPNNPAHWDL